MTSSKPTQPIRLHRMALSGHAHRVQLFLSLLGLPYEMVDVDLRAGEHKRPEFLRMNCFGQVPVIQDGDVTLGDSNAILVYLEGRYAPGQWLPRDPVGAAQVQRWLSVAAGQLAFGAAAARVIVLFKRPDDPSADDRAGPCLAAGDGVRACNPPLPGRAGADPRRHRELHLHRARARRQRLAGAVPERACMAGPHRGAARLRSDGEVAGRPGCLSTAMAATFHEGEVALQERAGSRAKLAEIGPRVIRDHMPDQHREFFAQLPFVLVGTVDAQGQPWASVLAGEPGFVSSPDPRRLVVRARPLAHDPLAANLADGAAIGLLGIEPHTRRRNRLNGWVAGRA